MGTRIEGVDPQGGAVIELEDEGAAVEAPGEAARLSIEDLLPASTTTEATQAAAGAGLAAAGAFGVRTARVLRVAGRRVTLTLRGASGPVEAEIAPEVDPEVIEDARANGDSVLVELGEGEAPLVVAALQTRRHREIRLRAATVHIEGEQEVLLRSGRGAIRIREDGDIEVVGSRISAASRGLFRIVGRLLRLN